MIKKEDVFKIGQFAKPHGVKGEIALITDYDLFDDSGDDYIVCDMDGILVPFFIEDYRYKSDTVVLVKLENVDDEVAAREFSGRQVYYPLSKVEPEEVTEGGSWNSLIGFEVVDKQHGLLGIVMDVDDSTINVLLKISSEEKELLLPAVDELILTVDVKGKRLDVSVPDGLLDI
ncbi:MAG: ribosome maturation factor RimM [Parabacteroides sp.]|nr:ribosome maturation factor RimM [Parabacteroides sp.]